MIRFKYIHYKTLIKYKFVILVLNLLPNNSLISASDKQCGGPKAIENLLLKKNNNHYEKTQNGAKQKRRILNKS